jgi:hypothetical protein
LAIGIDLNNLYFDVKAKPKAFSSYIYDSELNDWFFKTIRFKYGLRGLINDTTKMALDNFLPGIRITSCNFTELNNTMIKTMGEQMPNLTCDANNINLDKATYISCKFKKQTCQSLSLETLSFAFPTGHVFYLEQSDYARDDGDDC